MDKITSDVRHKQWLDIIHACNASGLTRKAWCEQNGIKIKTFYYWQRQLRREAHDAHMTALPAEPEVAFAEVALPASPKPVSDPAIDFCPDVVIRTRTLTIECADRYLSVMYDWLHEQIYSYHVLQADETPVIVTKDGRHAGSKSYMWVYRTEKMYRDKPIILYEYQKERKADHPREFLKAFSGVVVTDGYEVYHKLARERQDLKIAGCWSHARRRFSEAVKAAGPPEAGKKTVAYIALQKIAAIYNADNSLADLSPEERLEKRQTLVKPLVEVFFAWLKELHSRIPSRTKTGNGFDYCLKQEPYLRYFLEDGEVPIDNNAAEQAIRPFCVGKKNWLMIDTVNGAKSSAIIYSIVETAKANNLNPSRYFELLLTEIPRHMEDTDRTFLKKLEPWSQDLPAECRKQLD